MDTLLTETGDTILAENILSSQNTAPYNDISVVPIYKETFDSNPNTRGWLVGAKWSYNGTNDNMVFTP